MDAGWELDAWLAEHIAGWTQIKNHGENEIRMAGLPPYAQTLENPWFHEVYLYSTDITAAFTLVERLRSLGFQLLLESVMHKSGSWCWQALFDYPDGHDSGQSIAATPAHAICLAARAVAKSQCFRDAVEHLKQDT